jgi:hypothetical protein
MRRRRLGVGVRMGSRSEGWDELSAFIEVRGIKGVWYDIRVLGPYGYEQSVKAHYLHRLNRKHHFQVYNHLEIIRCVSLISIRTHLFV